MRYIYIPLYIYIYKDIYTFIYIYLNIMYGLIPRGSVVKDLPVVQETAY